MRIFYWLLSLLVPGSGQAMEGRFLTGFLLMFTAICGANVALLGKGLFSGEPADDLFSIGLAVYVFFALFSLIELIVYHTMHDPRKLEPILTRHLANATQYYLQGKYDEAEAELRAMLRKDPEDIEAHLYLASVYRATGDAKKARKMYAKVTNLDEGGKWSWQVARELKEMES
ncbi:MAG: tetratricopeptide repeat protein [Candidatus Brocadiia bacterium]